MINFGMRRGRSVSTALTAIVRHHEVSAAEEALGALQEAGAAWQRADRAVERLRAAAAKAAAGAEDAVLRKLADCAKEAEKPLKVRRGVERRNHRTDRSLRASSAGPTSCQQPSKLGRGRWRARASGGEARRGYAGAAARGAKLRGPHESGGAAGAAGSRGHRGGQDSGAGPHASPRRGTRLEARRTALCRENVYAIQSALAYFKISNRSGDEDDIRITFDRGRID